MYEVSNTGKIRSNNYLGHNIVKEISLQKDQKGYIRTRIFLNGKRATIKVHREVAKAFIYNPFNKPEVNHKDGDKSNNHVNNLEWATPRENTLHAYKNGLKEKTREHARKMGINARKNLEAYRNERKTKIVATNILTKEQNYFNSQAEAAQQLKVSQSNINKVLKRQRKSTKNYTFDYVLQGGDAK